MRKAEPLSDLRTGGPALLYGHWICDHCKNVVQAETLARKRKIEKGGRWSAVGGTAPLRFFPEKCGDLKGGRNA